MVGGRLQGPLTADSSLTLSRIPPSLLAFLGGAPTDAPPYSPVFRRIHGLVNHDTIKPVVPPNNRKSYSIYTHNFICAHVVAHRTAHYIFTHSELSIPMFYAAAEQEYSRTRHALAGLRRILLTACKQRTGKARGLKFDGLYRTCVNFFF